MKTFEIIDDIVSKDKNNVYFFSQVISNADLETFEHLKGRYSKDKNHVYF
jgi:hypothetical protein